MKIIDRESRRNNPPTFVKLKGGSAVERLVELGEQDQEALFRDQYGQPHALIAGEPVPLNNNAHPWLRKLYWNTYQKTPKRKDLAAAADTLAMFADHSREQPLHIRVCGTKVKRTYG
jgi:hypothetical protein